MDTPTLVALITAGTSLTVSLISVWSVIINSRNSARSDKEIETLKYNLDLERQAIQNKKKEAEKMLSALTDSIKAIQKVKDVIQLIIEACKDSHLSEAAIDNITHATTELVTCYEERFTELVKGQHSEDIEMFHNAKKVAIEIQNHIISALNQKTYVSDLLDHEKMELRLLRSEISEIQIKLQNSLYDQYVKFGLS